MVLKMTKKQKQRFICVRCPRGCEITTILDGYTIEKIEGNLCKLGIDYVNDEISGPRRVVTSTVRVKNGKHPLAPVWTEEAIPKDKIFELMRLLRKVELKAPIKPDNIVIKNIFNSGFNVVTSGKVEKI